MKYSLLVFLACTITFVNCESTSSDDDTYSIEVTNSFQVNLDIYTQEGTEGTQTLQGTLNGSSASTFSGFAPGITYTLTATEEGGTPDNWYDQVTFDESNTEIEIAPRF